MLRAVVLLLLVLLLPSAAGARAPENLEALRQNALQLVNEDRERRGLHPLALSAPLNSIAQSHAADMLRRRFYAHVSPDGRDVRDRFLAAGGSAWLVIAENLARCAGCPVPPGRERVAAFQSGWMNSPTHRENILMRGLDGFGFGLVFSERGEVYAVQTFSGAGASRGGEAAAQVIPPAERAPRMLDAVNAARAARGLPPLEGSNALNDAAATILEQRLAGSNGAGGRLFDALPRASRGNWSGLSLASASCGGCGARITQGDIGFFAGRWRDDRGSLVYDRRMTHLGVALAATGEGRKTAVMVAGRRR